MLGPFKPLVWGPLGRYRYLIRMSDSDRQKPPEIYHDCVFSLLDFWGFCMRRSLSLCWVLWDSSASLPFSSFMKSFENREEEMQQEVPSKEETRSSSLLLHLVLRDLAHKAKLQDP